MGGLLYAGAHLEPARSVRPTKSTKSIERELPAVNTGRALKGEHSVMVSAGPAMAAKAPEKVLYSMGPTADEFNEQCVVIDANHDQNGIYNTWTYNKYFDAPIYWEQGGNDADDWLIFPAVNIEDADKLLRLSIDAANTVTGAYYYEQFEVFFGKEPTVEAMNIKAMEQYRVQGESVLSTYTSLAAVQEPGEYYIGVHCISDLDHGFRLLVKNLKIEQIDAATTVPMAVTELSGTPDSKGALVANMSFRMPTKALNGTDLPAGTQVQAKITSPVAEKVVTGVPGELINTTIEGKRGDNQITVLTSTADGEGLTATVMVTCGPDAPKMPVVTTSVSDDNMSMTMSWSVSDKGINGGPVDPENVYYDVYRYNSSTESWTKVLEGTKETSYSVNLLAGAPLQYIDMAVSAYNDEGGENDAPTISELLGTPYTLPLDETLSNQQFSYTGLTIDTPTSDYKAQFGFGNPASVDEYFANTKGAALIGMTDNFYGTKGSITLPKFSTMGQKGLQVILPIFLFSGTPDINVYGKTNQGERVLIGTVDRNSGAGWSTVVFNLPESLENKPCVSITLDMNFPSAAYYFFMEGYSVKKGMANDMSVDEITVEPSKIVPGEKAVVTAKVTNLGMTAAAAPELTGSVSGYGLRVAELNFVADNEELVPARGYMLYTAEFTLNTSDFHDDNVNITATIAGDDENNTNNSLTVQAGVGIAKHPVVNTLRARFEPNSGNVELTWDNPMVDDALETCEYLPLFSYESTLGKFLNLDFDNGVPYTLGDVEGIGITDDTLPKAFQVISAEESGLAEVAGIYGNNNSDRFLMAFSPQEAQADDWLISEEVAPGSAVSFFWDIITSEYPETIEVLYSTTDRDVDSFTHRAAQYNRDQIGWQQVSVLLPDDARYFAIHYCSNDAFGIMIDDIAYSPAGNEYSLTGYSLLRDDDELVTLPADATSFRDETAKREQLYTYHLVPSFMYKGASMTGLRSNTATVSTTGIEQIAGAKQASVYGGNGCVMINNHAGKQVVITDLAGRVLLAFTPDTDNVTLPMPQGFYVVAGSKVVVK